MNRQELVEILTKFVMAVKSTKACPSRSNQLWFQMQLYHWKPLNAEQGLVQPYEHPARRTPEHRCHGPIALGSLAKQESGVDAVVSIGQRRSP